MRKSLLLLFAFFCFLYTPMVKAQELQRFKNVLVEIWPEFDQPGVLVIIHFQLPDDVLFPIQVPLLISKYAELFAVAYEDPRGELLYADYSIDDLGEWTQLLITTNSTVFQIEYYQPLPKTGNLRQIEFSWQPLGSVDEFSVIFQNPLRSSNVQLNPESVSTQTGRYNLIYSSIKPLSLEANQIFEFSATYEKPDDELSIANLPQDVEPPLEDSVGQPAWNSVLPWIIGGIGLLFIGSGTLALFSIRARSKTKSQRFTLKNQKLSIRGHAQKKIFCHNCGQRAEEGDQYCRSCGVKLRYLL